MYLLDKYSIELRVELNPGMYIFSYFSATGKSYLAKDYYAFGEDVYSYTYHDYLSKTDLAAMIANNKFSVILIDRYDMYVGYCIKELQDLSKHCVVLIDLKSEPTFRDYRICSVHMKQEKMVVS